MIDELVGPVSPPIDEEARRNATASALVVVDRINTEYNLLLKFFKRSHIFQTVVGSN